MKTLHNEKSPDECPACKESVWVNADRLMTRDETILEVLEYIRTKLVGKSYTDAKYVADDIEEYFALGTRKLEGCEHVWEAVIEGFYRIETCRFCKLTRSRG